MQGGAGADIALSTKRARSWWALSRVMSLLAHRPGALRALATGPLTFGMRVKLAAAAEEARRFGATNVHAHFAYRSADGAEVVGRALGTGHTVTTHGHDLFVPEPRTGRRFQAASTVVTVCQYNRSWLEARFGSEVAGKVVVIPCGTRVDGDRVRVAVPSGRASASAPDRPVTVVAIGRLVPKKGLDVLVRAAAMINGPMRLVIVGDGPERTNLSDLARRLGVDRDVVFTGAREHSGTLAWLGRADIFCVPFRIAQDGDRDSMPVVVKEAMVAALPVVSTAVVGVPEMVIDGVTGLLVPPDDPAALASALGELIASPARRAEMGRAGRRLVEEK